MPPAPNVAANGSDPTSPTEGAGAGPTEPEVDLATWSDLIDRVAVARLGGGRSVLLCGRSEHGVRTLGVTAHASPGVPALPQTREGGETWFVKWPLEADDLVAGTALELLGTFAEESFPAVLAAIAGCAHSAVAPLGVGRISTVSGTINRPLTDLAREQAGPADAFQVVGESSGHLQMRPGRVVGGEFTPMYDRPLMLARSSDLPGWDEDPECSGPEVRTAALSEVPAPAIVAVLGAFVPADPARTLPWYLLTSDRRLRALSDRVPQLLRDVGAALTPWSFDPSARPGLADETRVLVARVGSDVLLALAEAEESMADADLPPVGSLWQASGTQFLAVTGHRRGGCVRLARLTRPGTELFGTRTPILCDRLGITPDSLVVTLPGTGDWVRIGDLDFAVPVSAAPLPARLTDEDLAMLRFASDPVGQHRTLPLGSVVAWPNAIGKPTFAVVAGHRSPDQTPRLEVEVMTRSTDPEANELPGLGGSWVGSGAIASVAPDQLISVVGFDAGNETHVARAHRQPGPGAGG